MAKDFLALLRRDHDELDRGLTELVEPSTHVGEMRVTLDGVRLGLAAHSEAEDIVLSVVLTWFEAPPRLQVLAAQGRAAHLAQEAALAALVGSRPGSNAWRDRALELRDLVRSHASEEESQLLPLLREHAPDHLFQSLAGRFATERLRQLAMLQPSAPIYSAAQLASL
jgi:hypothetical protein